MRKDFPLNAKIIHGDREVSIRPVATRQRALLKTRAMKFTPLKRLHSPNRRESGRASGVIPGSGTVWKLFAAKRWFWRGLSSQPV